MEVNRGYRSKNDKINSLNKNNRILKELVQIKEQDDVYINEQ